MTAFGSTRSLPRSLSGGVLRTALLALAPLACWGALLLPAPAAALSTPPAQADRQDRSAPGATTARPAKPAERSGPPLPADPGHDASSTQCAVCHTVRGWREVAFDHARTGFPLIGAHQTALCSRCHGGDLAHPVPKGCAACHRDAHIGEFGARCSSCHEESSWRPLFSVDAHRRTNFPLTGRHALIPCEQCHTNVRDRSFTRTTVGCVDCHQADYARTSLGNAPDHLANNFPTTCRTCHAAFQWKGARFPAHDACFELTGGPHAGIPCLDCHTSLPRNSVPGTCKTNSASCTRCHQCASNQITSRHTSVAGFQCKDRKCWECHKFSSAQLLGAPRQLRSR